MYHFQFYLIKQFFLLWCTPRLYFKIHLVYILVFAIKALMVKERRAKPLL